jgi:hypothetical protein
MKLKDIAFERLCSQNIEYHKYKSPSELVAGMGALQAQDYAGAKWSIGLRVPGITDKNVEKSLKNKSIVRTWALRGTLHFVSSSDLHWMIEILSPHIIARNNRRYKQLNLDDETLLKSNDILNDALADGNQLTRTELLEIIEQEGISTEGQRAAYMLQRASLDGLICQSVMKRNIPTYISTKGFIKSKIGIKKGLKELASRYFNSHGPATLKDFVWWSGLLVKDARTGLDAIKSQLKKEIVNGQTYWMTPHLSKKPDPPTVNILPGFDEYLLSYRDRSASINGSELKDQLTPTNGMFSSTIVIDGQVEGTWKRKFNKNDVIVSTNYFRTFTSDELDILYLKLKSYSEFTGKTLIWQ